MNSTEEYIHNKAYTEQVDPIVQELLIKPDAPVGYLDECPMTFPPSSFPAKLPKRLKGIQDPNLREFWEHTLSGNFKVLLSETPSNVWIHFTATTPWQSGEDSRIFSYVVYTVPDSSGDGSDMVRFTMHIAPDGPLGNIPRDVFRDAPLIMIHWLLRQNISSFINTAHVDNLFHKFMEDYVEISDWTGYYDLMVVRSCWGYHRMINGQFAPSNSESGFTSRLGFFQKPGEALEADKRFGEAGDSYLEASKLFSSDKGDKAEDRIRGRFLSYAALARKRNFEFEEALSLNVQSFGIEFSLFSTKKSFDPNDEKISHWLRDFFGVYIKWCAVERSQFSGDLRLAPETKAEKFACPLACLLTAAKWQFGDASLAIRETVASIGKGANAVLKPSYLKKMKAREHLFEAFQSGSASAFHECIFEAMKANVPQVRFKVNESIAEIKKMSKDSARELVDNNLSVGSGSVAECGFCDKLGENYMVIVAKIVK
ncbi:MAG: hypothetical protein SGARI_001806 [Bacillariaceae sp.]